MNENQKLLEWYQSQNSIYHNAFMEILTQFCLETANEDKLHSILHEIQAARIRIAEIKPDFLIIS